MVWNLLLLEAETVYLNGQVKFGMQTTGSLELYIGNFFRPSHGTVRKSKIHNMKFTKSFYASNTVLYDQQGPR